MDNGLTRTRHAWWPNRVHLDVTPNYEAGDAAAVRTTTRYELSHLDMLESESIHIIREVAAEFERPVLLFSGGKDSIVMLRLAEKAFWPASRPFPLMHVDTGHNFPEVLEFRDKRVEELGVRLVVERVQDAHRAGKMVEQPGRNPMRNGLQTPVLLDGHRERRFDAVFGGARRDEEKARAKERVYSFRDEFGQWDPKNQRPELWYLYNGRHRSGEHIRIFPLSNWTELDIWQYIEARASSCPASTSRMSGRSTGRTACCWPSVDFTPARRGR